MSNAFQDVAENFLLTNNKKIVWNVICLRGLTTEYFSRYLQSLFINQSQSWSALRQVQRLLLQHLQPDEVGNPDEDAEKLQIQGEQEALPEIRKFLAILEDFTEDLTFMESEITKKLSRFSLVTGEEKRGRPLPNLPPRSPEAKVAARILKRALEDSFSPEVVAAVPGIKRSASEINQVRSNKELNEEDEAAPPASWPVRVSGWE